jgi:molybdenum cofactor cytidylyltransferase
MGQFVADQGTHICVPLCNGRWGNPVVWPREFYADILELSGDRGARALLDQYSSRITEVPCEDPGVLMDIDTPDDLAALT